MNQTLKTLKLSEVHVAEDNLRATPEEIAELAASIETVGLLEPPVVIKNGDGYKLVAGERRYRALEHLGRDDAKFIVQTGMSEEQRQASMLIENMQRVDLTPKEEAEGVRRLIQEHGFTQTQVSEQLGVSKDWVKTRIALLAVPDHVFDAPTRNGRPLNLDTLAKLGELPDDVREKLTKGDAVPEEHQVQDQAAKVAAEEAQTTRLNKLRKDGYLAFTFAEIKKLVGKDDLTSFEGNDFVVASKFHLAEDLATEQYYSTSPRVKVPTVLLREILNHNLKDYDWQKDEVYVLRKVGGYPKWHTAKLVMPPKDIDKKEEGEPPWVVQRKLREAYALDVFAAVEAYLADTVTKELTSDLLCAAREFGDLTSVCYLLGLEPNIPEIPEGVTFGEKRELHDEADRINHGYVEGYATKSAANAVRTAMACLIMHKPELMTNLPIGLPKAPKGLEQDAF